MNNEVDSLFKNLKKSYDSGDGDDLGNDFFTPCLKLCNEYLRNTSDFTSNVIFEWGEAVVKLINKNESKTKIRIIAHPKLHENDLKILKEYVDNQYRREEYLEKLSDNILDEAFAIAEGKADQAIKLKIFSYLIASKILELKFAFPHHVPKANVFHSKFGVYKFNNEKKIAFIGGPNETLGGHSRNIEDIEIFSSTDPNDLERIIKREKKFEEYWKDNAKGFRTKSLSKKTLERIYSYSPKENIKKYIEENKLNKINANSKNEISKKEVKLWKHQEDAIQKFLKVKSGVLEMATGTGKTITSLEILKILANENKINSCIICTDGIPLLKQWNGHILNFLPKINTNIKKVFRHFDKDKDSEQYLINPNNSLLITSRENLQKSLPRLKDRYKKNTFIIHDEVHGFGSPSNVKNLKGTHKNFIFKLGMSATPERVYDEEGDNFILEELGKTFKKYKLGDAIRDKVLCKMDYVTNKYFLSDDETKKIQSYRKAHYAKKKAGEKVSDKKLYTQIAGVHKNAASKIKVFADYIKKDPESIKNTIIFVYSEKRGKQISHILQGKVKYGEFFSGDIDERLDFFAKGKLNCLITCHRLSEGIDIKGLKNIFLIASDRAKLETIQRIGRCLRVNPKEPNKKAKVIDFIDSDYDADKQRAEWLNELSKI